MSTSLSEKKCHTKISEIKYNIFNKILKTHFHKRVSNSKFDTAIIIYQFIIIIYQLLNTRVIL